MLLIEVGWQKKNHILARKPLIERVEVFSFTRVETSPVAMFNA
jgi:hypothetical protein